MFSRRQSQAFPLSTVGRGAEFVATLRLIYPYADTFCERDFDWLFDCPQTKQFLECFCSMVSEENVLTPAEVEAYDALLAAGKPILEGDALEQVLQTCCQDPQLISLTQDDQGPSLEALQQELQELQDYRDLQLWRYRKLQVLTANLQQELRYLEEEEKVVKRDLRKAEMDLEVDIFQTSAVLSQISKDAKQLAEWHGDVGKGRPPALLCEMDLGPYMELEQEATDASERFIQQVLPGSIQDPGARGASAQGESSLKERLEAGTQMDSDSETLEGRKGAPYQVCAKTPRGVASASQGILVQGSKAKLLLAEGGNGREVLSMGDEEERDIIQEATERMQTAMPKSLGTDGDEVLGDQDSYWKEVCHMEKARICAQREVIVLTAKAEGNCAALEWAQRTLEALEENQHGVETELQGQAAMLQEKLHALRCDITYTLTHQLLPLLKAEASLSCLPILQRQFSLEAAHLQYVAGRQKEAAVWLAKQHSRLDLLELHLEWERKELDQKAAWMREMETAMREAQTRLQEQQDYFKHASSSQKVCPCAWTDPKDLYALRLWDMLVGQDQKEQLFHSYKALAAQCSQLVQEKRVLEAQLAAPMSQLPALKSSTEVMYRLLYNSSNQLQLSSPEITKLMQQLDTMQDNLLQMLTDLLSDLKIKRRCLESPILQTERNLYVYFYCDEDRLREVVEELEKQVSASSKGPLMELPHAKE
ncbi:HAUS augmin-like complex subunit 3 [Numenius arquata]|uniref:HAUS augmin-like complex subunit 3 n=1 Tax=Numenius arquata TaxID=31919 RepID=UPI003D305F18